MLDDEGGLLHGGPLTAVDTWERGKGRGECNEELCVGGVEEIKWKEGVREKGEQLINHMRRPDVPTLIITFIVGCHGNGKNIKGKTVYIIYCIVYIYIVYLLYIYLLYIFVCIYCIIYCIIYVYIVYTPASRVINLPTIYLVHLVTMHT